MRRTTRESTPTRTMTKRMVGMGLAAALIGGTGLTALDAAAWARWDDASDAAVVLAQSGTVELSEADVASLIFMRQEEKLAGDLYQALGEAWNLQVFTNIERAERTHESQVAALLADYGIADPVATLTHGEFADPDVQALYDELLARGLTSAEEALRVGALVEELDIEDLRASSSEVAAIDHTYDRLEAGSHNHLRAFVANLERRGVDYEPVVLDADLYAEILAEETGGGNAGRGQGRTADGHGGSDHARSGRGQAAGHGERQGEGQGERQGQGQGGGRGGGRMSNPVRGSGPF